MKSAKKKEERKSLEKNPEKSIRGEERDYFFFFSIQNVTSTKRRLAAISK